MFVHFFLSRLVGKCQLNTYLQTDYYCYDNYHYRVLFDHFSAVAECKKRCALCYRSDIHFYWYEAVRWANLSCDVSALHCQCPLSSEGPLSSLSRQEGSCDDDSKREKERKQEGGREMESRNDRQLWVELSITGGGGRH